MPITPTGISCIIAKRGNTNSPALILKHIFKILINLFLFVFAACDPAECDRGSVDSRPEVMGHGLRVHVQGSRRAAGRSQE